MLCEHTQSREQVEAAVKCALESMKLLSLGLTKLDAARLCSQERPAAEYSSNAVTGVASMGPVLACAKEVGKIPASAPGSYLVTPNSVVSTCAQATSNKPGLCLAKLASISSSRLSFDANVPETLCAGLDDPLPVIACLEKQGKRMINADDVSVCVNTKQEVRTLRVIKLYTEDNDIEVTAGRRFLIWFELLDQWGRKFLDEERDYMFSVSLNANNPQGAVLWGLRSNYSQNGVLQLNSVVISQPGPVQLRVSTRPYSAGAGPLKIIESFNLVVKEDESAAATAPCVYVFKEAFCPAGTDEGDWIAEFPRIRSFAPAAPAAAGGVGHNSNYFRNIQCAGDVLAAWHVNAYLQPDGGMWVEYRLGIDAIWTGIGMPKMEMGAEERLGLIGLSNRLPAAAATAAATADEAKIGAVAGKKPSRAQERQAQKELRRAYYRKSLQWHPDRWVGMSMYTLAVQGAFELITEAYGELTGTGARSAGGGSDDDGRAASPEHNPEAYA